MNSYDKDCVRQHYYRKYIQVVLPFKDQESVDMAKNQLEDLSHKVQTTSQPVFVSGKVEEEL